MDPGIFLQMISKASLNLRRGGTRDEVKGHGQPHHGVRSGSHFGGSTCSFFLVAFFVFLAAGYFIGDFPARMFEQTWMKGKKER